ncbi:uncharacterized protein EDB91DRAFT_640668 [Suillus paluster]|uniref:uncharacterized protein n=1 Tax=Suillus paluster TaxID=48578 RepID=UPI001B861A16|nr:uncharacterized protein EDB91DRAFT_640668 [Suillus paluster]KAG1733351.1 hypothetical protein EDB91DRAFT_640668 [Suillus paluster]
MENNGLSFYSNVFGLFIGATTILGILLGFFQSHLPSQRIKELEELLEETQGLYESAVEDGLLPEDMLRSQMGERLAVLREATLELRSRAYSATTLLKDYREFFRGLSYDIGVACFHVKELRASVITTSEAERRRTGVYRGNYSTVPQVAAPPQISCAVEMRSVPRAESHDPHHLHAGCIVAHADAPHAPCGLHDVEVDLTELSNLSDCSLATFPCRIPSLDTASLCSDDSASSSDDNSTMESKVLPGV